MCPSNYNRFWDRAIYWSKIVIFSYHLAFDAPVRGGGFPSEHRHPVWYGKTTLWWKKIEDISVRFGATHERDGQTDRQTDTGWQHIPRLCIASRGKNHGIQKLHRPIVISTVQLHQTQYSTDDMGDLYLAVILIDRLAVPACRAGRKAASPRHADTRLSRARARQSRDTSQGGFAATRGYAASRLILGFSGYTTLEYR